MRRNVRIWAIGLTGLFCALAAGAFPFSRVIDRNEVFAARAAVCALILGVVAVIVPMRTARSRGWLVLASVSAVGLAAFLIAHLVSSETCIAHYESRPVIVGFELQEYVRSRQGAPADELLFDAGGNPERAWTHRSILACHAGLLFAGLGCLPLAALLACSLIQAGAGRLPWISTSTPRTSPAPTGPYRYDAFISYRHADPDRAFALDLLERLEARGLVVAFDERDFRPNQAAIDEMERSIRESRFTLCVVSPRYIASGYCSEEAEVCKTLDMEERQRRLVPLILERAPLPAWFHGLVGVDFSNPESAFDPYARVESLLKTK